MNSVFNIVSWLFAFYAQLGCSNTESILQKLRLLIKPFWTYYIMFHPFWLAHSMETAMTATNNNPSDKDNMNSDVQYIEWLKIRLSSYCPGIDIVIVTEMMITNHKYAKSYDG